MRIAGEHMNRLDLVARNLEGKHLVRSDLALLDPTVARDNDEKFPFRMVPVLALGDARLRNVDRDLAAFFGFEIYAIRYKSGLNKFIKNIVYDKGRNIRIAS